MYSPDESLNQKIDQGKNGKGKAKELGASMTEPTEHSTSLKDVLNFIDNQFTEHDTSTLHGQPHFKVGGHDLSFPGNHIMTHR